MFPLFRAHRFAELCDAIAAKLEEEKDPDFRFELLHDLGMYLHIAGDRESSFEAALRLCEEFGSSPFAWMNLADWYRHSPHRAPTREEMETALGHFETALQRARADDEWVRFVLFDICRLLTEMEDYPRLEAAMREVLDDLSAKREIDIPRIEGDWLKRVPEGRLDADLLARYRRAVAADAARMPGRGYEIHPATLDELEG